MKKRLFALALSVSMIMAQVTPTFAVNLKSTEALDTEIETVEMKTEETEIQTEAESLEETVEAEETFDVEEPESEIVEIKENLANTYVADGLMSTLVNTDVSSATSINVNTMYTDNLSSSDDVNWYKFTVSSLGYISLDFKHDYVDSRSVYWEAYLYNADQKKMVEYDYTGEETTYAGCNIGITAGTYYLKVSSYNYSDKNYNFKINYTSSSIWETEFNDDYKSADSIDINQTYYGSIMNMDDEDWYKFNISGAGYISLTFKHDYVDSKSNYWEAYLYNADQEKMVEYDYAGSETNYTGGNIGVPAGTYYLKVVDYNHSDNDYNFKINYTSSSAWETEFNDDYKSADNINVNQTYYGSLMSRDDEDWYCFKTTEAGYISLTFRHDYVDSKSDYWEAYLYNADQEKLVEYDYAGIDTTNNSGKIGLPAGTYYLRIINYNYSHNDYNFKINYTPSSVWETEFNNSYTTADKINYGKTYYGSLMNSDDEDWYKVEVTSGGTKMFYFKHDKVDSSSTYWKVYMYNSDMSEIWDYDSAGNTISYSEKIKLSKGTYYLRITDYNYSDGTYNFQISGVVSKPGKATLKKSTNDSNGNIKVNWEKVKDANGYYIYKKDKDSNYKKVADVASDKTSYIDKSGSIGSKYTYTVRAYKKSGDQYILGDYDKNGVNGQKIPAKVILATIKNNSKGQVNLTWEKVSGIDGYRVYRKASGEGWKKLKDVTATSITDTSAKIGVTYSYTVRAYKKINGNLVQGSYDSKGLSGKRVPPTVQLVSAKYQKDKGVVVNWKKTDDCSGYVIYRKDTKSGWTRLAKVSGKDNVKYTDKVRSNINTYKYTVRAYQTVNAKEILGGYDKSGVSVTK